VLVSAPRHRELVLRPGKDCFGEAPKQAREACALPRLDHPRPAMITDLRYAIRQLIKSRGFTAVAILTLALGVGANTAVFSVVDAVLLRALPYHNAERLIDVFSTNPTGRSRRHFHSGIRRPAKSNAFARRYRRIPIAKR
jgi:hypothetical protein